LKLLLRSIYVHVLVTHATKQEFQYSIMVLIFFIVINSLMR